MNALSEHDQKVTWKVGDRCLLQMEEGTITKVTLVRLDPLDGWNRTVRARWLTDDCLPVNSRNKAAADRYLKGYRNSTDRHPETLRAVIRDWLEFCRSEPEPPKKARPKKRGGCRMVCSTCGKQTRIFHSALNRSFRARCADCGGPLNFEKER